jgi:hypothetical protein
MLDVYAPPASLPFRTIIVSAVASGLQTTSEPDSSGVSARVPYVGRPQRRKQEAQDHGHHAQRERGG